MSEELKAQPEIKKKVHFEVDQRKSAADIYMSTESLRVHDRPWVEGTSPASTGHTDSPPAVSFVGENTNKTSHVQVFLAVICLTLIIWIIVITAQAHVDRKNWAEVIDKLSNLTNGKS